MQWLGPPASEERGREREKEKEGERKRERGREASFTEHNVFKMHPPVVCFGTVFLFMAELYSIVQMDHILFIHSSADEYLCYSHFVTTKNNADYFL